MKMPAIKCEERPESLSVWAYRGDWIAQEKVDGERALLEWGKLYGRNRELQLPGELPAVFADAVLDCELKDGTLHVFDLVAWNGVELSRKPLSERLDKLASLVPLFPVWMRPVATSRNLSGLYDSVIAAGGEGVVVKSLRGGWGCDWVKVKKQHTEDVVVASIVNGVAHCFQGTVDCGKVNCFSHPVSVGDVIEVACHSRHASGKLRESRFLRIRKDKTAAMCG